MSNIDNTFYETSAAILAQIAPGLGTFSCRASDDAVGLGLMNNDGELSDSGRAAIDYGVAIGHIVRCAPGVYRWSNDATREKHEERR